MVRSQSRVAGCGARGLRALCLMMLSSVAHACTPAPSAASPGGETSGSPLDVPGTTTGISSDSNATDTLAGTETGSADGGCQIDADCGELRCIAGACYGCTTNADCPADQRCWSEYCRPLEEVPACLRLEGPACRDGSIGALEECETGPSCEGCLDSTAPQPWVVGEAFARMVLPAAGGAVTLAHGPDGTLVSHASGGDASWSVALEHAATSVAVDETGSVYVAGSNDFSTADRSQAAWLASWDASGSLRWSIEGTSLGGYHGVAVDDQRVVAVGWIEQVNAASGRGWVVQHDRAGAVQWSQKIASVEAIGMVTIVGPELVVLAYGLAGAGQRMLLRLDTDGVPRWTLDVSDVDVGDSGVLGIASDGASGTWIYGERHAGPWASRIDADGTEIARLDCLGATTGMISHLEAGPDGRLAVGVLVTPGVLPLARARPWLAIVDGEDVAAASVLSDGKETLRMFGLGWRSDGKIAIGLDEYAPRSTRIVTVDP